MSVIFVLAMLVLIGVASAETMNLGYYTVSFNYTKPHQNVIDLNSSNMLIKTFDGNIVISTNPTDIVNIWNAIKDKDSRQTIIVDNRSSELLTAGDLFALVNQYFMVNGHMPLYDLVDFLKSLKIKKTNSTK